MRVEVGGGVVLIRWRWYGVGCFVRRWLCRVLLIMVWFFFCRIGCGFMVICFSRVVICLFCVSFRFWFLFSSRCSVFMGFLLLACSMKRLRREFFRRVFFIFRWYLFFVWFVLTRVWYVEFLEKRGLDKRW